MPITGTTMILRTALTNPVTKAPQDAPAESLSLLVVDPNGKEATFLQAAVVHDGLGLYHKEILGDVTGLWHYRWLVDGEAADEGSFQMETAFNGIGKQETNAALEGEPVVAKVNALTQSVPAGIKFVIAGDTNAPKIVFTTTAFAAAGGTELHVTASGKIMTPIAAGLIELEPEDPDLTDLAVLVPRARRACEGPYGAPPNRPELTNSFLYAAIADACGQVILFSGSLFGHELLVKERDPLAGFPTKWKTNQVLNEWEGALLITQVALDYFFFLFRDMKVSQTIKNEGTEWTYSLSANVIRNYLETLKDQRDKALDGLRLHNPVYDRYISNIRVRDQATVAVLEWWSNEQGGAGMPGGQEASVIPWAPGDTSGFY